MSLSLKGPTLEEVDDEPTTPLRKAHGMEYIRRFLTTKNSWKGKYARVFCICEKSVVTLNPTTFEVTNEWTYASDMLDVSTSGIDTNDFSITVRKEKTATSFMASKSTKISFSCEHRAALVTALLRARSAALATSAADGAKPTAAFQPPGTAFAGSILSHARHATPVSVVVGQTSLELRLMAAVPPDPSAASAAAAAAQETVLPAYCAFAYEDLEAVRAVRAAPDQGLFALHHGGGRVALLNCAKRRDLISALHKAAGAIGIGLPVGSELGLAPTPQSALLSLSAKAAIAACQASGGSADGTPLGPHPSSQAAATMACGAQEELLAPILEAPVLAFDSDEDDLRCPAPKPSAMRTLILTDTAVIERDVTKLVVSCWRPLHKLHALLRDPNDEQSFELQYVSGVRRLYTAAARDAILASLLEAAHAAGHGGVHVLSNANARIALTLRLQPLHVATNTELEALYLKALAGFEGAGVAWDGATRALVVEFNANVPYSGPGVPCLAKWSKLVAPAMLRLHKLGKAWLPKGGALSADGDSREGALAALGAMRRLLAVKAGIDAILGSPELGHGLVAYAWGCLEWPSLDVSGAAMEVLSALLHLRGDVVDLGQEQQCKRLVLDPPSRCQLLTATLSTHLKCGTGALLLAQVLEAFCFVLCVPHSETTLPETFASMLRLLASLGRPFFRFFSHPCLRVAKAAGLLMAAQVEEGDASMVQTVRHDALSEGALLEQLHNALFLRGADSRALFHRQLSRRLVALWATGHPPSSDMLMRAMPPPLLRMLSSPEAPPPSKADAEVEELLTRRRSVSTDISAGNSGASRWWQVGRSRRQAVQGEAFTPRVRQVRVEPGSPLNWPMLWYGCWEDLTRPDLLWNQRTREELREALAAEVKSLRRAQQLASDSTIEWNHLEFEVLYPSLESELRVGEVYLRLLLDGAPKTLEIHNPGRFFNELYHRLLWEPRREIRLLCLQGMAVTYQTYHRSIGPFPDTSHVIRLLSTTLHRVERDRYLLLIRALLASTGNSKAFMRDGGLQALLQLLTTVHMESERSAHSQVLQSNLLTTSAEREGPPREWHVRPVLARDEPRDGGAAGDRSACGVSRNEGPGIDSVSATATEGDGSATALYGPFNLDELKAWLDEHGGPPPHSGFELWAKGMGEFEARSSWKTPREVPQVTWACMARGASPILSYTQLGVLILDLFLHLTSMYPTRTSTGALIHPMPTPMRILSASERLPHLVQLLLTMEPSIVERSAQLLTRLVEDNPTLPRLYLTGAFFFALMYTGSNVLPIIRFLRVAHMSQLYRDEETNEAGQAAQLSARSYLTLALPSAMVCCLEAHGADKFAEVFLGDFDTPEYIWNHEMRRYMIERLALHVGELPVRLQSHCTARYEYCPLPRIAYPELKEELFCHRYYLRHLCDEARFGDWPIDEPVALLQAILSAWHAELKKVPSSMSREEALGVLGLQTSRMAEFQALPPEQAEAALRKAYHRMASKFHPDKNPDPSAREVFERVQKAYELASAEPRAHGGPDPHNVSLMLRAQVILYERCANALRPFKYSGYPLLLKVVATTSTSAEVTAATAADGGEGGAGGAAALGSTGAPGLFSSENEELLLPAAMLLYRTVEVAPLNAHELQRVGGIETVVALFRRCVSMLTVTSEASALPYRVALPLMRTFAVVASCPEATQRLASDECAPALDDIVRCLHLSHLPHLSEAALEAVSALCVSQPCQVRLARAGAPWHALAMLTKYDFTLDEAVKEGVEANAESNAQLVANERARRATHCLRCLGGYRGAGTAIHLAVRRCALRVLTQYLSELLDSERPDEDTPRLLMLLNSASETPYLIWNGSLRSELLEFVNARLERSYKVPASAPLEESEGLTYDGLRPELKVGSIYVRVYTEHPTYPLHDAPDFCHALLDYLSIASPRAQGRVGADHQREVSPVTEEAEGAAVQANTAESADRPSAAAAPVITPAFTALALHAMHTLLTSCHNFNLEEQLLVPGRLPTLFSFAAEGAASDALGTAIRVAAACCNSAKCVGAIGDDPSCYLHLFPLLRARPPYVEDMLALVTSLAAHPKVVGACLNHGALLHALYLFACAQITVTVAGATVDEVAPAGGCGDTKLLWSDTQRAIAGGLLCRLATDRTHGAHVQALVQRLMPVVFLQTMGEDALRTVAIFDASHENPELIWDAPMRTELRAALSHLSAEALTVQQRDCKAPYALPADFKVEYPQLAGLLCISGVYIKQLLLQPAWQLRDPRGFLEGLLHHWAQLVASGAEHIQLDEPSQALVVLLQANPALSPHVAAMGYLSKVLAAVANAERADVQKASVSVVRVLTESTEVVNAMRALECVTPLLSAMRSTPSTCTLLLPSLTYMAASPEIVEKAVEAKLVPLSSVCSPVASSIATIRRA